MNAFLGKCLRKMIELGGHDLIFKVGSQPGVRVSTGIILLPFEVVKAEDTNALVQELLNPNQQEMLERNRNVDFAFSISEVPGRFRGNFFFQQGLLSLVVRKLWGHLPSFEALGIPEVLRKVALERSGIILIGGTVAMGKTTTIHAMVDLMNQKTNRHIIAIEDPVEYWHEDKGCVIQQREIGQDTSDYYSALKYVVRQSPDVIVIGEMRDSDSFNFALSASEVGRLVISTIHAKSVLQIFDRVSGFYRSEQYEAMLNHLSYHIVCFAVQRLLVKKDGRTQVPVFEILIGNSITRQLIRNHEFDKLPQAIHNGAREGMQLLDQAIFRLWRDEVITTEEALSASEKPAELEKLIKGIRVDDERARILGPS